MALHVVNAGQELSGGILAAAAELPSDAPIIVMIHGYRFSPTNPRYDPHGHILSLNPDDGVTRAASWPAALGFGQGNNLNEGLGIAFGWEARGSLRKAYKRAGEVGQQLSRMLDTISTIANRPVALMGHSLGGRVALCALDQVRPGVVGRTLLLTAAEFRDTAQAVLDGPGGQHAEVFNVTTRENDLYDCGLELLLAAGRRRALGFGLNRERANWLDLQMDDPRVLEQLHGFGFDIETSSRRMCHWSPYLRPGVFQLYRMLLRTPNKLRMSALRSTLPQDPAARWSRLWRPTKRPTVPSTPAGKRQGGDLLARTTADPHPVSASQVPEYAALH